MHKTYSPADIEQKHYQHWEEQGYFQANEDQPSELGYWSLMIPPPNVTGSLHMGHAFQDTLMDFLVRYHRMKGFNTLWQPGTDHAGIATQMVVERQLASDNISKESLGRKAFIDKIWQWKKQSGSHIAQQLRRMGCSADWQRERFTMDAQMSKAVTQSFVTLYEQGLIYKGTRLVNWDPKFRSAISDLEVINVEEQGKLYYVRYFFVDGDQASSSEHMTIATTRPETILADGALAVNPNDERYQHLVGRSVFVPLTDRRIPIIADDYVDPNFGTGCVKITPAHDFNDYKVGQRHQMEIINLFTADAHMSHNAPSKYVGMERFCAREAIITDLHQQGHLKEVRDHSFKRPYGDRSNVVIEPFLTDQWFVDTQAMAQRSIDAVKNGDIEFVPSNWQKTYFQWLENIQDWCISRQLWWGHQIPAWYADDDRVYVAVSEKKAYELARNDGYKGTLRQDEDVLDTWFSSALWPFSTLGWPDQTPSLKAYFPTSVLVTGFDIIFFWVARMVMFSLHFTDQIPFKQVYVHGLVRDASGQKMSKTKGNVIDPIDIIDGIDLPTLVQKRTYGLMQPQKAKAIETRTKAEFPHGIPAYGCDALRFTFMAMASTGRDIRFDISRCEGYRNFCNKLWNASRFCLMNVDQEVLHQGHSVTKSGIKSEPQMMINQWIQSRLNSAIKVIETHIQNYRFDLMATQIYELIWRDFCDWYIEMAKPYLNQSCPENKRTENKRTESQRTETQRTLYHTIETLCRLAHPIIPFITAEIWQNLPLKEHQPNIVLSPYPEVNQGAINETIENSFSQLQQWINVVRRLRSTADIKPNQSISLNIQNLTDADQKLLHLGKDILCQLCKIDHIEQHPSSEGIATTAGHLKLTIPFAGNINRELMQQRLEKDLNKLATQLKALESKLNNAKYLANAPTEIINKTKTQVSELSQEKIQLEGLIQQLLSSD